MKLHEQLMRTGHANDQQVRNLICARLVDLDVQDDVVLLLLNSQQLI
jgi:hypothetical protein